MAGEAFGLGKPEAKAALAKVGLELTPAMTTMMTSLPPGVQPILVLDRVVPGVVPEFCVHGYVQCVNCFEVCWLGDATHAMVVAGEAYPLCVECAKVTLPRAGATTPDLRVEDRLRSEGPH